MLRRIGVRVKVTSSAGEGLTDLLLSPRQTLIAEIKRDDEQSHAGAGRIARPGARGRVVIPVFTSVENALLFFGARAQ
jgi:hypothetical protein